MKTKVQFDFCCHIELDQEKFSVKHMCSFGGWFVIIVASGFTCFVPVRLMYKFKVNSDTQNTKRHNCALDSLLDLFLGDTKSSVLPL